MLHIITENNELKNKVFYIPNGVRKVLNKTLKNYKGSKTIEGYKRLCNLVQSKNITYSNLKRIKNFFDHYSGSPKSAEFILNGGDAMKTWVNNTLYTATKAVKDFKQAKKDAGLSNAFIKPHEKNRQSKVKKKPTMAKIATKNVNRKIIDNSNIKFESKQPNKTIIITEEQNMDLKRHLNSNFFSLEVLSSIDDYNEMLEYCRKQLGEEIGSGSSRIVFQMDDNHVLKLALDERGIAQNKEEVSSFNDEFSNVMPIVFSNDSNFKWIISEYVLQAKEEDFEKSIHMSFDDFKIFLVSVYYYIFGERISFKMMDWDEIEDMLMVGNLNAFFDFLSKNGKVNIGDMLRIENYGYTVRNGSDGSQTSTIVLLDSGLNEEILDKYYRKKQPKNEGKINEAMKSTFSFETLSNITSFKGRLEYCKQELGVNIGRGSGRVVFQIDDHYVLKLALNKKGVAQNELEIRDGRKNNYFGIFPIVSKFDENSLWLVTEYVLPAKKSDFKTFIGTTFEDFCEFINYCEKIKTGKSYSYFRKLVDDDAFEEYLEKYNEDINGFYEYILNTNVVIGDMLRISSYGITDRNGYVEIVLLDYGLNDYVFDTYYKRY